MLVKSWMSQPANTIDARVLLKSAETQSPLHLVISPYPDQYEEHITTNTGVNIFIRPIRSKDASLLVELFESLSPRSVYLRFFTPMKRLPQSMLTRFTQIDYDRHIALVALMKSETNEKMLGVARVISGRNLREAEFSVIVSDPWQGKGIGAALLQRCLFIAKEHGIQRVMGTVLAENTHMLALGRKLGFNIKKEQGVPEYELSIDFRKN
jgi:acetyltransferase